MQDIHWQMDCIVNISRMALPYLTPEAVILKKTAASIRWESIPQLCMCTTSSCQPVPVLLCVSFEVELASPGMSQTEHEGILVRLHGVREERISRKIYN